MKDTEFFERALELRSPWFVEEVKMDVGSRRVEVVIGCRSQVWGDPQSAERLHIHGYEKRRWRHLDTMQFETVLVANVPRVKYPDGHTELVRVPWAEPHGRFTLMFEAWAIAVLQATSHGERRMRVAQAKLGYRTGDHGGGRQARHRAARGAKLAEGWYR